MKLADLLSRLSGATASAPPHLDVTSVSHDSRRVGARSLFVAIHGFSTDGNAFVEAAVNRGAVAVVSEAPPRPGIPWIQVGDAREALAILSAAVNGNPTASLRLAGITGTNGKTTTAFLLDAALRAAGRRGGLLGTVQHRIGERVAEAVRTTPEASDLQVMFRALADTGCEYAVLEVSSHSLALKRVHGCRFEVAVFTNLTRDHLDFHGDMSAYLAAKRTLFESLLREDGHAILNADDDHASSLARASRGRVWTFGLSQPADFKAEDVSLSLAGTRFRARTPVGDLEVRTQLLGRFNVANALAALGAALALDVSPQDALQGIASLSGVPGRMERVETGRDFTVLVDYAHTDDALRNLLETVRGLSPRRVITVFGCGGDRDRSKRPLMGAVAVRLSDIAIVTSDNPRSEPPEAIVQEILRGMNGSRGAERHTILDRHDAIARAIELAEPGDAVVIAGKGHETYQILRDRSIPFDDRQVARAVALRSRGSV